MIKVIIIDDEPYCIKGLQNDLGLFCPDVQITDSCLTAKEGILAIKRNNPDLIFLDVQMPWMNGFEMLEIISREIIFKIILITANEPEIIKSLKIAAVDYLVKPVDRDQLARLVADFRHTYEKGIHNQNVEILLKNLREKPVLQKIAIPSLGGFNFVPMDEILYCKENDPYTDMVLINNKTIIFYKPSPEIATLLPGELFEFIFPSLLINIAHIRRVEKKHESFIVMENGDEINIPVSQMEGLLHRLGV